MQAEKCAVHPRRSGKFDGKCWECAGITHKKNGAPYVRTLVCTADDCDEKVQTIGLCTRHYARNRYVPTPRTECEYPDCDVLVFGRLCSSHSKRPSRFSLSVDEYLDLVRIPSCGGCGTPINASNRNIDHDHAHCVRGCRECIRGILCRDCNLTLGHARDDIARLEGLIAYIQAI